MPRNKITTDAGTVEVQWSKDGQLVCLVVDSEMYQFTDADELTQVIASLRRARRQAFPKKAIMTPEAAALREANIKTLIDEAYGPPIARTNKA